jgi:peroxiredoxin
MAVEVGGPAPGFELKATIGKSISLERYRGRPTVILFFPLAFSPICTNELTIMRDEHAAYKKHKAQILAVSVDSPFTLKAWAEKLKLPFPLLSDFNKEVAQSYGALHQDLLGLKGVAKRSAFVIDKDGIVRYRWVSEDPGELPDFDEILAAVEKAATS